MERRMKRRIIVLGVLLLIVLALTTCSNPIDILASITTEVKAATGKFLVVKTVTPSANATAVSPGTKIVVVFDRSIDQGTIAAGIVMEPAATFSYGYNDSTKTLTITPAPLDGGTNYSVRVTTALKGADQSELQSEYVWTFGTANVPYGSFTIQGSAGSPAGFSLTTSTTLVISPNLQAMQMRFRESPWTDLEDGVGWTTKDVIHAFPLSAGDGPKTVYMQFATFDGSVMSEVVSSTIVLDTAPTTITIAAMGALCTLTPTRTTVATASSANGIATKSWTQVSGPAGGTITFGTPAAVNTTVTANVDGGYVARLTATDGLGLPTSANLSVLRDTVVDSVSTGGSLKYINIATPSPTLNGSASDSAGAPSCLWTGTGLTFGTPTAAVTTVTAGADGTYTATLTATDNYLNTKTASITVIRDTVAPNPPVFSAKSTPSPTVLSEPTWVWDTGGGGGSGFIVALYDKGGKVIWEDGKYKPDCFSFPRDANYLLNPLESNHIYPLADGSWPYTLGVQERDPAGNWSTEQRSIMNLTQMLPLNGATGVTSPVTIQWHAFGANADYVLHLFDPKGNALRPIEVGPGKYPSVALEYSGSAYVYTWYVQEMKSGALMPPVEGTRYSFSPR